MSYQTIRADAKILDEFPGLTQGELDRVNDLYDHYLFYQKQGRGRRVWTSCCHRAEAYIGPDTFLVTPEDQSALYAKHNEVLICPFCGKTVTAKSVGLAQTCISLKRFRPVVLLSASEDGATVYAQAYWTIKDFAENYAAEPRYSVTRVYRLRRGEVLQWEEKYNGGSGWHMVQVTPKWTQKPFILNNDNAGYVVLGTECLVRSFLRYTRYQDWCPRDWAGGLHTSLVRFLALAAHYPEWVELLMKAGMQEPIKDYIYRHIKNAKVLRWGEADPRKALGLSKEDLKAFLATGKSMETLYVLRAYRRAGVRLRVEEADAAVEPLSAYQILPRDVATTCARAGVKPERLERYLRQYTGGCHAGGYRSLREILRHWWDYIGSAKRLNYDLGNQGVLLPRDLEEAHDNAAVLVRRQEEEKVAREAAERSAQAKEALRLKSLRLKKRLKALEKKYAFSDGTYCIRAAKSAAEIIAEGKALSHCVAGYADRHLSGALTLLFLRRADAPDTPLVTIEMDGTRLVQIHGYTNERRPCPENPKKTQPELLYAEILDPWLAWVQAGSKRNKAGRPVVAGRKDACVA